MQYEHIYSICTSMYTLHHKEHMYSTADRNFSVSFGETRRGQSPYMPRPSGAEPSGQYKHLCAKRLHIIQFTG
jgi:hypothetical protein